MALNHELVVRSNQSPRVHRMLAAAIRAAALSNLQINLSKSDSFDIARVHDLRSALQTLEAKQRLHSVLPRDAGLKLAIAETKLVNPSKTLHIPEIEILRQKTQDDLTLRHRERTEHDRAIRRVQEDIRTWRGSMQALMVGLEKIFHRKKQNLIEIELPYEVKAKFMKEMEAAYLKALEEFDAL